MIKIDWFDKKTIDSYWEQINTKALPDTIEWYNDRNGLSFSISKYNLFTQTREDLFKDSGIRVYVEMTTLWYYKKKRKEYISEFQTLYKTDVEFKKVSDNIYKLCPYIGCLNDNIGPILDCFNYFCEQAMNRIYSYEFSNNTNNRTVAIDNLYKLISSDLRTELMMSLDVGCCPYCNRLFVTSLKRRKNKCQSTADLDHFYNKDIFPLFALSLFNFVPSCHVCNSNIKSINWADAIYPFEEEFGNNGKFVVDEENMKDDDYIKFLTGTDTKYDLKLNINVSGDELIQKKINNSKELFALNEIYKNHIDYAKEVLAKKHYFYNEDYLKSIRDTLGIHVSEDVQNLILFGYRMDENDKNRPLSKLTHDLLFNNSDFIFI